MFVRVCLLVCLASPAFAATHQVPAGGDLQAALDAAQPGDVIELQSGATYVGNFRLPVKPGREFIVLRTGGVDHELPGPGVRINKTHAPWLAKLRSGNSGAALTAVAGSHHWRVELLEFEANANGAGDMIALGGTSSQTQLAQMPFELVLDRVYVHGDPRIGQKRGVALNSGATQIINSYFEDFKVVGQEAQAICGWNGAGPYLIENNYVQAATQSIFFGGADPSIQGLVPSDITIRRNVMTKPLAWRKERWLVKNGLELKNSRRVLIEGNVIENVWEDDQNGFAVLFTVRNQNGRSPWSTVEDVTFRYNIIRNAGGAINVLGHDDNPQSQQVKRLQISDNLAYNIDKDDWGGTGDFVQLGEMPRDIVIERNTVFHDGIAIRVYGGRAGREILGVTIRDNVSRHNTYGVKGDGTNNGNPTFARYMPGVVFERNVLAGGPANQYPAGNYFPPVAEFEAQFVNPAAHNFAFVAGSTFHSAGTGGAPLGADLAAMDRVMNGIADPGRPDPNLDPEEPQPLGKRRRHRPGSRD